MNRKEIDLLTMMESVAEGLDNNISLISDKQSIMEVHTKLKGNLVDIKLLKQKQAPIEAIFVAIGGGGLISGIGECLLRCTYLLVSRAA